MAAAERIGQNVGRVGGGSIVHRNVFYTAFCQFVCQNIGSCCSTAINRTIGNHNCFFFRLVSAPFLVFIQEVTEIATDNRPVQRTNHTDFQPCSLAQQCLYLRAVFAHDVGVITTGIFQPFTVKVYIIIEQIAVQCAPCAECIGREQNFISSIVSYHYFRPVYHWCHHKGKYMTAGTEGIPFFYNHHAVFNIFAEKLVNHS